MRRVGHARLLTDHTSTVLRHLRGGVRASIWRGGRTGEVQCGDRCGITWLRGGERNLGLRVHSLAVVEGVLLLV